MDVGTRDAPELRLRTTIVDKRGHYAALSYCWGAANSFVTTSETIHERLNGFSLSSLPRTLREAVVVLQDQPARE
jgi:hypothetical protein